MQNSNYKFDKTRFETFFDAIIAIVLTILVLELKVPESEHEVEQNTRMQILRLIPTVISYVVSFFLIVGLWIDHHILFLNISKITKSFILLNMLFILSVSVIPFSTGFAGHNYHDSFAVALLFANYCTMNFIFSFLYLYAFKKKLLPGTFIEENKWTGIFSFIGIFFLIAAIPIAFFNTYISFALGIVIFNLHLFKRNKKTV
jgi:uncharacterized membrane protein